MCDPASQSPTVKCLKGDVLQLIAIVGLAPATIERRVGFHAGRLARGYQLWFLDEPIGPADFEWGATTRYPGNWYSSDEPGFDPNEAGRVEDELRWRFYKSSHFQAEQSDARLDDFKRRQAGILNDRSPTGHVVKILPVIPHDRQMPSHLQYPVAQGKPIRQWKLHVPKRFILGASLLPGSVYRGGGTGDLALARGRP